MFLFDHLRRCLFEFLCDLFPVYFPTCDPLFATLSCLAFCVTGEFYRRWNFVPTGEDTRRKIKRHTSRRRKFPMDSNFSKRTRQFSVRYKECAINRDEMLGGFFLENNRFAWLTRSGRDSFSLGGREGEILARGW